ncbi:MAG: shikimate dehydrogenase [Crocinitomicaceae bacterium]|nr:shikimate dehydrogenase [Crocinitomicaceae bacterium]
MSLFGLVGKSLSHSFSRDYFSKKFDHLGILHAYENFEFPSIEGVLSLKSKVELKGFNVTIPYKTAIIPYLDELSEEAVAIGAVNTVKIEGENWIGHNTDAFGFKQMIAPFLKGHQHKALIIGTGGASKAVAYVLEGIGLEVNYLSRDPKERNHFPYEDVNTNMIDFHKVIVNCTPLGTFPNIEDRPSITYDAFTPDHLAIDLIYNPAETKFLSLAKAQGAKTLNGLTMLEQQAEKSWEIWNQ